MPHELPRPSGAHGPEWFAAPGRGAFPPLFWRTAFGTLRVVDGAPGERREQYRADLALVHHLGFGSHADACTPGILRLLEPVKQRGGLVVELGCGSGALTRHLVAAGLRVIATDASPAMVALARSHVQGPHDIRRLVLPEDPVPAADAVVSVGHVLNYLSDEAAIERALAAAAASLRPGGVLAFDLADVAYGVVRRGAAPYARVTDDWAVVTTYSQPHPLRFVRAITTFVGTGEGGWRRDDERHENVLFDALRIPELLAVHGVDAAVGPSFGGEQLPAGLVAIVGERRGTARPPDPVPPER